MHVFRVAAMVLVIIGALNWGLVGFFDYDLVGDVFGWGSRAARVVYALIGLAGLLAAYRFICKCCSQSCGCCNGTCKCTNGTCKCTPARSHRRKK